MTPLKCHAVERREGHSIVEQCINEIKDIASLPAVARKLTSLCESEYPAPQDITRIITSDPALCVRILKVVNSAFYGLSRRIASIEHAVLLLGFDAVRNIAIAASLHKLFRGGNGGLAAVANDLWLHSIAVAAGARTLAETTGLASPNDAFLAGLIHDIGITIEFQARPREFRELLELVRRSPCLTFRQAEEAVIGATHESFGAALCRKWNLPSQLEYVVGFHHAPLLLPKGAQVLPAIVHVADFLASRSATGYSRTVEVDVIDPQVFDLLRLSESDADAANGALKHVVEDTLHVFSA